jgi:hypothetical protein
VVEKIECANNDYVRVLNNQIPSEPLHVFTDCQSHSKDVAMVLLGFRMECVKCGPLRWKLTLGGKVFDAVCEEESRGIWR